MNKEESQDTQSSKVRGCTDHCENCTCDIEKDKREGYEPIRTGGLWAENGVLEPGAFGKGTQDR